MGKTIAHIDGDEVAYLIAYQNEFTDSEQILNNKLDEKIEALSKLVDADVTKVYLSGRRGDSFRRRILPEYKAHRDKREPPRWLRYSKEYLLIKHQATLHPRLEADDLLGIAITANDNNLNIAITQDKDIKTVTGLSINPKKPDLGLIFTSLETALLNLMTQVLCGDPADGYKGCPGIGPSRSKKILKGSTHRGWQKIYREYLRKGLTREDLRINYICAKILRRNNGSKKEK